MINASKERVCFDEVKTGLDLRKQEEGTFLKKNTG